MPKIDVEIIVEVKECPICHCSETISQRAAKKLKEEGRLPQEVFTSLTQLKVPMLDPMHALVVPTLMVYQDACAECGFARTTKAETYNAPVTVVMQNKQQPQGFDFKS